MRALAALSLGLVLVAQQTPPQQPVFRAGTELVQIDAVVVDKDGRHVYDLTKADFEIIDNGKRQVVVAVNEYRHDRDAPGPLHTDVATNSANRLVVIALDDEHKKGAGLEQAKDVAREFIRALAGQAQMALVRTSTEPGVEFTTDAQALLDALDRPPVLGPTTSARPTWGVIKNIASANDGDPPLDPQFSPGRAPIETRVSAIPYTDFGAVRDASILANDGRRKAFIVISEGSFHERLRGSEFLLRDAKDNAKKKLSDKRLLDDLTDKLTRLLTAAQRSNSSIYVVDPRERRQLPPRPGTTTAWGESIMEKLLRDAMTVLSTSTGGYATGPNQAADAMERALDDLNHYYVLGFSPTDRNGTKPHTVDVRVKRPDLVVRARQQYQQDDRARTRAMAATAKDPLLGLAYSALPSADLPLRAWATTLKPTGDSRAVPIAVWLDSLGTRVDNYGIFIIDMLTNREVGKPVGRTLTGNVPTPLPLEAPALPPGRYQIRVSAQSQELNRGGSVYFTLEVPDVSVQPLAIANLVLGSGDSSRRDLGSLAFEPMLDRTFAASDTVRLAFEVWRRSPSDVKTSVEIVDTTATVARTVSVTMPANGNGRADMPLSLAGLAPGAYTIVVTVTTATSRAQETIGIVIRP
jgi:VWFA-related protein